MKYTIILAGLVICLSACKKKDTELPPLPTITDIDGNIYKTVTIGTQEWMAENLRTTTYNDGSDIPNVEDNTEWTSLTNGAYCWFDNDIANKATHGALYNWRAIESNKICPSGWHVPSTDEWTTLRDYIAEEGGFTTSKVAYALKSKSGWYNDGNGSDHYRFNALPSGYRMQRNGAFHDIDKDAYFWSSTPQNVPEEDQSIGRYIQYQGRILYTFWFEPRHGASIRCVKD